MEKSKTVEQGTQGVLNHAQVKKFLIRDLQGAIQLLTALQTDPDLLDHMASFMLGRLENHRHQKDLQAQQKLEV